MLLSAQIHHLLKSPALRYELGSKAHGGGCRQEKLRRKTNRPDAPPASLVARALSLQGDHCSRPPGRYCVDEGQTAKLEPSGWRQARLEVSAAEPAGVCGRTVFKIRAGGAVHEACPPAQRTEYTDCAALFRDCGWWLTSLTSTVYSSKLLRRAMSVGNKTLRCDISKDYPQWIEGNKA